MFAFDESYFSRSPQRFIELSETTLLIRTRDTSRNGIVDQTAITKRSKVVNFAVSFLVD